jgi:hypothetical protein
MWTDPQDEKNLFLARYKIAEEEDAVECSKQQTVESRELISADERPVTDDGDCALQTMPLKQPKMVPH